jgi:hypothetical protein
VERSARLTWVGRTHTAELLFVPRDAKRQPKRRLTMEQTQIVFSALNLRERLMAGLAILAGS